MIRYGPKMRILIVGGGIAGLALAALLRQRGADAVDVVEKATHYGGVGYVLGLWPAGGNVMKSLNLFEQMRERSIVVSHYVAQDDRGRTILDAELTALDSRIDDARLIDRAQLLDAIRDGAGIDVRFGTSLDALHQGVDGVDVYFSDGTSERYDCVVGADGVHSKVRDLAFGRIPLHYSGMSGWAFWTQPDGGPAMREFYGDGKMITIIASKDALCAFAIVAAPPGTSARINTINEVRALYASFPSAVLQTFDRSEQTQQLWRDDFSDLRLKRWWNGRVALVGDAAAAMLPTAGVGASMAIESAAVLAQELCYADSRNVTQAFTRYETRRRKRVDGIQMQSRYLTWLVRARGPFTRLRNGMFRAMTPKMLANSFRGVLSTSV